MTHSLRLRLLLAGTVSITIALTVAALILAQLFDYHVERRLRAELEAHLNQLVAGLEPRPQAPPTLRRAPADPRFQRPFSGLYWQLRLDPGATLLRSRSLWDQTLDVHAALPEDGAISHHHLTGPKGSDLLAVERRLELPARYGFDALRVTVASDRAELSAARDALLADLWPYLGVLGALLIVANALQVHVGLRPLTRIQARLAQIRSGGRERLGAGFPNEIQPLASELDALLAARAEQIQRARARAADLAHGLKTPLQVLLGEAERLRRRGDVEAAQHMEHVIAHMERHVQRELARARLAVHTGGAAARVGEVVDHVVRVLKHTPSGEQLQWHIHIDAQLSVGMDAADLTEALGSILENAVKYASKNVWIQARATGARVRIVIIDDGPGIPHTKRQTVLERGHRLDESGNGSGIGLAIAVDILAAWDGRLELAAAGPGDAGLSATLDVPGLPAPSARVAQIRD